MPFHLESLWGATLMAHTDYRLGVRWTETEQNSDVSKNFGLIFSRLWTKVHEILGQCRDPL